MKRYDTYKDSGVQWIGEIPSHWNHTRISRIFQIKAGGDAKQEFYSYTHDERHPYPVFTNTKDPDEVYAYTSRPIFDADTITVTGRGEIGIAFYRDLPYDAIIRLLSLKPKIGMITRFFMYAINIIPFTSDSAAIGQLSAVQLGPKMVPIPPLEEQEGIVAFLDEKTAEIDELVRQVEREIELLKEYKQAEIARVVTRGLNPNAPLKPSGISWIGDIPQHWELRRAKYVFQKHKRPVRPEDEVITCFRDGEVTLRKNRRTTGFTESLTETGYQGVRKGDLVIHQMDAFAGAIGISDSDGKGTPVYHCCTPITNECTRYFCYQIRMMAFSGFIQSLYRGIRERSSDFNFQVFGNQYLFIPPLAEQQEIVEYIDRKTTEIDRLVVELTYQVEYLKEYKHRLIADVVTGKINVQRN